MTNLHAEPQRKITETEYWEKYYNNRDVIYEWNNGYLEEKQVSDFLTYLTYKWFFKLLDYFLLENPIADITGLEMGFRLALPNNNYIRRPDLGVVLHDNPVPLLLSDRTYKGTFDLCIEALSDSSAKEISRDVVTKKGEYAASGVKEYYILYGYGSYTEFYHLNAKGIYVPIERIDNDVIQSSVLPGFQFRISDLSKQPSINEMIDDPIYKNFVLPSYQNERIARQKAEQYAELVKQQAQAEAQQAHTFKQLAQRAKQQAQAEVQRAQKAEAEIARLKALLAAKDN